MKIEAWHNLTEATAWIAYAAMAGMMFLASKVETGREAHVVVGFVIAFFAIGSIAAIAAATLGAYL